MLGTTRCVAADDRLMVSVPSVIVLKVWPAEPGISTLLVEDVKAEHHSRSN